MRIPAQFSGCERKIYDLNTARSRVNDKLKVKEEKSAGITETSKLKFGTRQFLTETGTDPWLNERIFSQQARKPISDQVRGLSSYYGKRGQTNRGAT